MKEVMISIILSYDILQGSWSYVSEFGKLPEPFSPLRALRLLRGFGGKIARKSEFVYRTLSRVRCVNRGARGVQ